MKPIIEYINESKYLSKLNLKGIPNSNTPEYEIGKNQESFIIDRLNETYPEYKWVSSQDYYKDSYNKKKDLIDGDIIALKDDKPKFYIDAKVASTESKQNQYGVICLNSILNFGIENHFYLCVNPDGSDFIVIKSADIKNKFNNSVKCLTRSKRENRDKFIRKDLDKYIDKFYKKTENVSLKDFMPSNLYKKI